MKQVHCFERAGLGLAPFKFVRFYQAKYQACPGAPIQPGAACDYCGTGIMNVFQICSADGKESKVGSDCIRKTGDNGLREILNDQERQVAATKKQARLVKENERIQKAKEKLAADPTLLANQPHPNEYMSSKGMTLRSYVDFLLSNGGQSGRLRAARMIEESAEDCQR